MTFAFFLLPLLLFPSLAWSAKESAVECSSTVLEWEYLLPSSSKCEERDKGGTQSSDHGMPKMGALEPGLQSGVVVGWGWETGMASSTPRPRAEWEASGGPMREEEAEEAGSCEAILMARG